MTAKFFEERSDQSEVKARIVQKYFEAWAKVIMPSAKLADGKIAYIDLYAGPGRYKDGSASTPLLVLERAIQHPAMAEMLVASSMMSIRITPIRWKKRYPSYQA